MFLLVRMFPYTAMNWRNRMILFTRCRSINTDLKIIDRYEPESDCETRATRKDKRMKRSMDRILTTHTGSLPRPAELAELLIAKETQVEA